MGKRHIGMDRFRWKEIQMRNKMWNMGLLHPVQDRAVGMLLHDTVTRKVRVSWLHGVKRSGWRVLDLYCHTEPQVSWRTAYFSSANERCQIP